MSKYTVKVQHLPSITELEMSSTQLKSMLIPLGLRELHLWDNRYWFTTHEDWSKVFAKVLLDMPKSTADRFDCENYAMLVSARTSELFKLNTLGIAIGQSPFGYHGYNIFVSEDGGAKLYYLEPQTGDIYDIMELSGYQAEIIIFGG